MSSSDDTPERGPASSKPAPDDREKRLADALRANLRRRKKPAKSPASGSSSP